MTGLLRAEMADPFGHRLHTYLFVAWAFCAPLGMMPWAKDVFLGALIVWSILRITIGGVACGWSTMPRHAIAITMAAWVLWSALSITWSPDPAWGADQIKALRSILIPFAAWPVLKHWKLAVTAFAIAGTGVAIIVLLQGLDWIEKEKGGSIRSFAFMGSTGLVLAATLAAHFGLTLTEAGRKSVVWHLAGAAITLLALPLQFGRGAWLAAAVSCLLLLVCLAVLVQRLRLRVLLITTVSLTGIAFASTIDTALPGPSVGDRMAQRIERAMSGLDVSQIDIWQPTNQGSIYYRLKMWNAARAVTAAKPMTGWGLGGLSRGLEHYPGLTGRKVEQITYSQFDPHSTYLYEAASTGLVGLTLFISVLIMSLTTLTLRIRMCPGAIAALGILAVWIICSVTETYLLSGTGVAVLAIGLATASSPRETT